jgi:hypothetical protein
VEGRASGGLSGCEGRVLGGVREASAPPLVGLAGTISPRSPLGMVAVGLIRNTINYHHITQVEIHGAVAASYCKLFKIHNDPLLSRLRSESNHNIFTSSLHRFS